MGVPIEDVNYFDQLTHLKNKFRGSALNDKSSLFPSTPDVDQLF